MSRPARDVNGEGRVEAVRRGISKVGVACVVAILVLGLLADSLGQGALGAWLLPTAVGVLVALPLVSLAAVLVEEAQRREWVYVGAVVLVIGMLIFGVVDKLR